jgi:putative ABC transport system substrate-binding protein
LLHDLLPKAAVIGFLVNPKSPNAESDTREVREAVDVFGQKLVVAKASTKSEIDSAFASFVEQRVAALFVEPDPFFVDQSVKSSRLRLKTRWPRSPNCESSPPLAA